MGEARGIGFTAAQKCDFSDLGWLTGAAVHAIFLRSAMAKWWGELERRLVVRQWPLPRGFGTERSGKYRSTPWRASLIK
jgi:hypothetical protein